VTYQCTRNYVADDHALDVRLGCSIGISLVSSFERIWSVTSITPVSEASFCKSQNNRMVPTNPFKFTLVRARNDHVAFGYIVRILGLAVYGPCCD